MTKTMKRYNTAKNSLEEGKLYSLKEAVELVKSNATAKFDETIEIHFRTAADPRQAEQLIRGIIVLPHGTGKENRVLVFASGEAATKAKEAGADYVGEDEFIDKIQEGWLEFETILAVRELMPKIGKLGRILGRKGLMPNPKTGGVVQLNNIHSAVEESKKGRVEYKMDKTGIIHNILGKASLSVDQLLENIIALSQAILNARPSGIKGNLFKSVFISSTMGPSIKLNTGDLSE
jgi:large subunit ribosomal protein L1